MHESELIKTFNAALDALINQPEKVPDYFSADTLWINYVPDHLPCGGEYRGLDARKRRTSALPSSTSPGVSIRLRPLATGTKLKTPPI